MLVFIILVGLYMSRYDNWQRNEMKQDNRKGHKTGTEKGPLVHCIAHLMLLEEGASNKGPMNDRPSFK